MEKKYQSILIILIILIIASGLLLFFFRNQTLKTLSSQAGVKDLTVLNNHNNVVAKNVLNTGILQSATFISLQKNVINFDFNNICQQGSTELSSVSVIINSGETKTNQTSQCIIGNNIPFVSRKK